jgi:hypothetical protein
MHRNLISLCAFLLFSAQSHAIDPVFAQYQERVEPAVESGLRFLAQTQNPDGSFPGQYGDTSGVVSLVGMAFLSKGHLPNSSQFGDTINTCIDFILDHQHENGLLNPKPQGNEAMYSHHIATLFLSEVSGMVDSQRQQRLDTALANALRLILDAQAIPKSIKNRGGWRYKPDSTDSDLSASGWALMALRSAKLNGANVPDESIAAAVDYIFRCFNRTNGGFGYQDSSPRETLAGCGLLCLELCGQHGDPELLKAGDYILNIREKIPAKEHEYYGNYYNAQATFQLGGNYWETYATWMYDHYLSKQSPNGSWFSPKHGVTYSTAMVLLSFTVPYRQLPIYQRDETVDAD